jgi:hypothetical protein
VTVATDARFEQRDEYVSISEEDLAILVATRGGAAYVMDLLSRSARPGRGAAPLLRAFGHMARVAVEALSTGRAHWFFGNLSIDVTGATQGTGAGITVDVMTDHGGPREHLFQRTYFAVPLEELRWMLDRIPELAGPLRVRTGQARFSTLSLYVPPVRRMDTFAQAESHSYSYVRSSEPMRSPDDTMKVVVSPESLFDPDSTSPVPALMAEMAHLSIPSQVDPIEL